MKIKIGNHQGCGTDSLHVHIKSSDGKICAYRLPNKILAGEVISESINDCEIMFDDTNNLPKLCIFTTNGNNFCLDSFTLQTQNGATFKRVFEDGKKFTRFTGKLDSNRVTNFVNNQIERYNCPTNGCPKEDVLAYGRTLTRENLYCEINPLCPYLQSSDPNDQENGLICTETVGSFSRPLYCCKSGSHANMAHCDTVYRQNLIQERGTSNENQEGQRYNMNNNDLERKGPYGINAEHTKGKSFTMTGPFKKITVKSRKFEGRQIIAGIRTEAINGNIQEIGMDNDHPGQTTAYSMIVPEGEHIVDVQVKYGWYLDLIGFMTNAGNDLGFSGGLGGGNIETILPRNSNAELFRMKGLLINAHDGKPAITNFHIFFRDY